MKVLIVGGMGFIGSYMTNSFLKKGYDVGIMTRNVPEFLYGLAEKVDLYKADITESYNLKLKEDYQRVIHLAAANDIDSKDPAYALKSTVLGTRACLELCRDNGLKSLIYFSTFQVYGRESGSIDEESPLNCKNDYAITHMFAEEYVKMYQRNYGIDYIIARPSNIYGAIIHKNIDRWSLVPNCFCKEAFEKQTITLLSSGLQIRDFLSLEDIANFTAALCENFESIRNEVINIAKGENISILEIAKLVKSVYEKMFSSKCTLKIMSDKPLDVEPLSIKTTKLKNLNCRYSNMHTLECDIIQIFNRLKET